MAESATAAEPVQRSVTFDLLPPSPEVRSAAVQSIRRYRKACQKMYAMLTLAQQAGARIEDHEAGVRVTPDNDRAKLILAETVGGATIERGDKVRGQGQAWVVRVGATLGYEMRPWFFEELYPQARAFVWDSARRDMEVIWKAKDPEFTKASRGWLNLQLVRQPARFMRRAIGFPRLTARPRLEAHKLTLNWDKEIGDVTFTLPSLDGGRYQIWRAIRDGQEGWQLGTLYLTERDGKLFAGISHHRPPRADDLDPERVLKVRFDVDPQNLENFIRISGPDGGMPDVISGAEARAWLLQMEMRKKELERRRAACGNPQRPWGHRKAWRASQDVLSRLTHKRELGQKDRNHAWTRRIVTRARSWRCGQLEIVGLPQDSTLYGLPWSWTQFVYDLEYKYAEAGGILTVE